MALRDLNFAEEMEFNKNLASKKDDKYVTRGDDLWLDTVAEIMQIRRQLSGYRELLEKEQSLKETLIHLAMQKDSKGGGIKLRSIQRKGAVDLGLVPELWGVDLDAYRKPSTEYWQICEDL